MTGCGVWTTHFVAMLAFQLGLPIGYDPAVTGLSAIIAIVLSGLGFWLAVDKGRTLLGGAIVGLAVAAMHYTGVAAMEIPADKVFDISYVAASVVIGAGLSAAALFAVKRIAGLNGRLAGPGLLTLAICGMHFTGMTALGFVPVPNIAVSTQNIAPIALAIAVAAVTFCILVLGLIGALDGEFGASAQKLSA